MALKRHELDNAIKAQRLPSAIMLFGESHFLIDRYVQRISNVADAQIVSLYHDEYDFNLAKAHLSQGSLFGDRSILIIKSEKKVSKKDLDILVELTQKNSDNIFIYGYYGSDYKASATSAFNKKSGGDSVRLFTPYENEAKTILLEEARSLNINMDGYSASHLLLAQNGDLALAFNELSKLGILDRAVTTKDIDELVFALAEVKLDVFINALLHKKEFKKDLQLLLEHGEDEIRIITAVSSFLTTLYLFYIYIKINGNVNSADILGYRLPPFIEKERSQLCLRFKQESYEKAIRLLLECELQMKSQKMDKNSLLIATLISLQAIL
ncbi:MAG: hypothetical protein GQ570_09160 [Helicobacteraceae bacterium]|nr:hypothetical protein [Helicobacteraceae bacterium]